MPGRDYAFSNFVKVVSWYDNEMGYSTKVVEFIEYMDSVEIIPDYNKKAAEMQLFF
jgi:hypothetical protein